MTKVKKKRIKKRQENLDHITWNNCGEKGHYAGNSDFYTQKNIKDYAEAFRNTKQGKSGNNPPDGGGEQKTLVKVDGASCVIMMGIPTKA